MRHFTSYLDPYWKSKSQYTYSNLRIKLWSRMCSRSFRK